MHKMYEFEWLLVCIGPRLKEGVRVRGITVVIADSCWQAKGERAYLDIYIV